MRLNEYKSVLLCLEIRSLTLPVLVYGYSVKLNLSRIILNDGEVRSPYSVCRAVFKDCSTGIRKNGS